MVVCACKIWILYIALVTMDLKGDYVKVCSCSSLHVFSICNLAFHRVLELLLLKFLDIDVCVHRNSINSEDYQKAFWANV